MAAKRTVMRKRPRCNLCGVANETVRRMRTADGVAFSACGECRAIRRNLGDVEV